MMSTFIRKTLKDGKPVLPSAREGAIGWRWEEVEKQIESETLPEPWDLQEEIKKQGLKQGLTQGNRKG